MFGASGGSASLRTPLPSTIADGCKAQHTGQIVTHLKSALTSTETDGVVSQTCASKARAAARTRRAAWLRDVEHAASFATSGALSSAACWGQSGHGPFGRSSLSLTQNEVAGAWFIDETFF